MNKIFIVFVIGLLTISMASAKLFYDVPLDHYGKAQCTLRYEYPCHSLLRVDCLARIDCSLVSDSELMPRCEALE